MWDRPREEAEHAKISPKFIDAQRIPLFKGVMDLLGEKEGSWN